MNMPKWLTTRRTTLIITAFLSTLTYFTSQNVPSIDDLLSANMTKIVEATKMSGGVLLTIIIILIGIFIYLWIDAGKEDKMDKLIKEMKSINRKLNKIEKHFTESRRGQ